MYKGRAVLALGDEGEDECEVEFGYCPAEADPRFGLMLEAGVIILSCEPPELKAEAQEYANCNPQYFKECL